MHTLFQHNKPLGQYIYMYIYISYIHICLGSRACPNDLVQRQPSERSRKLHPRTAPTPFSISSLTSSGGGCLLSLTSTRVLSHSDARARFEHLHISRQGCCCGVTGTLSYSSILQVLPARQRDHWILRSGHIHRTPPCLHTDTPETICNTGYGMAIPSQRE